MEWDRQVSFQLETFLRSRRGREFIRSEKSVPAHSLSPLMSIRNRTLFFGPEGPRTLGQVRDLVKEVRPDLIY